MNPDDGICDDDEDVDVVGVSRCCSLNPIHHPQHFILYEHGTSKFLHSPARKLVFMLTLTCLCPAGRSMRLREPSVTKLVNELHLYLISAGLHCVCLCVFYKLLAGKTGAK